MQASAGAAAAGGALPHARGRVLLPIAPLSHGPVACCAIAAAAQAPRTAAPPRPFRDERSVNGRDARVSPRPHQQQQQQQQRGMLARRVVQQQQQQQRHLQHQQQRPAQPPELLDAVALMHAIKAAATWQDLLHLHLRYRPALNPLHISAMLTHLAQISARSGDGSLAPDAAPLAAALLQDSGAVMHRFKHRQAANCLWALAKLGLSPPGPWLSRVLAIVRQTCGSGAPQELANVLYALACRPEWLGGLNTRDALLHALLSAVQAKLLAFKPQELGNLLWAAATLHAHRPLGGSDAGAVVSAVLHAACERAPQLNPQEVANVLWAAGKLSGSPGLCGPERRRDWGHAGSTRPPALLTPPQSSVVRPLLVQCQALVHDFGPATLSGVVLGVAALGLRPPRAWVRGLLQATQHVLPACRARELANVALGLAYLGYEPHAEWSAAWRQCVQEQLPAFGPQELANTAWALARLRLQPPPAFTAQLLLAAAGVLPDFKPPELVMLLNGLAQLNCRPDQAWQHLVLAVLHDHLRALPAAQLAGALWALTRMGCHPPPVWMADALAALQPHLGRMSPQSLAQTLHALGRVGWLPSAPWCSASLAAIQVAMPAANVRDVTSILWAVAALGLSPPPKWVAACVLRCTQLLRQQLASMLPHEAREQPTVWPWMGAQHTDAAASMSDALGPLHTPPPLAQLRTGGKVAHAVRVTAAHCLWSGHTLAATKWALASLGHTPQSSPEVAEFFSLAAELDAAGSVPVDIRTRKRHLLSLLQGPPAQGTEQPGVAHTLTDSMRPGARLRHAAGDADVEAQDLVLQGMLNLATARFGVRPGHQETQRKHPGRAVSASSCSVKRTADEQPWEDSSMTLQPSLDALEPAVTVAF